MSRIRANKLVNRAATGAPELTYGAQVLTGMGITGAGGINVTGVGTFGKINASEVTSATTFSNTTDSTSSTTGAVIISGGVGIAKSLFVGNNVTIGGTVTYEDVTNVDSVGIITAQTGIKVTAGGIDITAGGLDVSAGIVTIANETQAAGGVDINGGLDVAGISTLTGNVKVGSLITCYASAGIVSATSFSGDGSNLSGISGSGLVEKWDQAVDNTEYANNMGTTWTAVQGNNLEVQLTPSNTSDRILVMFNWGAITAYESSCLGYGKIMRDIGGNGYADLTVGTDSSGNGQAQFGLNLMSANHQSSNGLCCSFIDHPNTTSQVTYRPYFRTEGNGGYVYINRNPRNNSNDISGVSWAWGLQLSNNP